MINISTNFKVCVSVCLMCSNYTACVHGRTYSSSDRPDLLGRPLLVLIMFLNRCPSPDMVYIRTRSVTVVDNLAKMQSRVQNTSASHNDQKAQLSLTTPQDNSAELLLFLYVGWNTRTCLTALRWDVSAEVAQVTDCGEVKYTQVTTCLQQHLSSIDL